MFFGSIWKSATPLSMNYNIKKLPNNNDTNWTTYLKGKETNLANDGYLLCLGAEN